MLLNVHKGKIHRATVTQAELDYIGSITIDSELMEAAGIQEYELVTISDCNNGNRLETYVIAGEPGSGVICLNGAAAHLVTVGDKVIIMNYCQMTPEEFADPEHAPHVVFVDDDNKISRLTRYEKHGKLEDLKCSNKYRPPIKSPTRISRVGFLAARNACPYSLDTDSASNGEKQARNIVMLIPERIDARLPDLL